MKGLEGTIFPKGVEVLDFEWAHLVSSGRKHPGSTDPTKVQNVSNAVSNAGELARIRAYFSE
jgi:hypothetical protein